MSEKTIHLQYRSDIDGLRALAVIAVVIFHAFPNFLKGGFIGVDIFFVISGYLISSIIFKNLENNSFSFINFYSRRINRIFPTLIVVLISCYIFGWFNLFADEFKQLSHHISTGSIFISNFILLSEVGYFDNGTELKPLLHLWSLAIEEQFYIIWPLVLWILWKRKLNLLTAIIIFGIISYYLNNKGIRNDAIATFYSPQTRAWELLIGSLLAWLTIYKNIYLNNIIYKINYYLNIIIFSHNKNQLKTKSIINLISIFGLILIIYGFITLSKEIAYPGKWALIPVGGTFLIIFAGENAWLNRVVLSNKLLVWFGLISFPLYLWHWPLLSFAGIIEGQVPSLGLRFFLVLLSVCLAWVSYRWIEKPFRQSGATNLKTLSLIVLMTVVAFIAYYTNHQDGLVSRFKSTSATNKNDVQVLANALKIRAYPIPEGAYVEKNYGYLKIGQDNPNTILFIGDSHTEQYVNTISTVFKQKEQLKDKPSFMFSPHNFPPVIEQKTLNDKSITTVFFSYYWAYKYGSNKVNQALRCCGGGKHGSVGQSNYPIYDSKKMDEIDAIIIQSVNDLKAAGKDVYFILDNPFGEELDPRTTLVRNWSGISIKPLKKLSKSLALERSEPVRSRLIQIAEKTNSKIVDPYIYLCNQDDCPAISTDGELLYKDYDHISLYASKNTIRYLDFIFEK